MKRSRQGRTSTAHARTDPPRHGSPPTAPDRTDPGGAVVVVCTGHRCAGLHRLAGHADPLDGVRDAVVDSRAAVLVSAGCLGACAQAPVAAVGHRPADATGSGPLTWLGGIDRPERAAALQHWIRTSGLMPSGLREAVIGIGTGTHLRED